MNTLYVLYDERCAICKRLKEWLLVQRSWIGLSMVPAGSARAKAMFPALEKIAGTSDLVVISDAGEVYLNNHAWIMCLYALEEYRGWALRLASPLLLPLARQAFETLSKNRQAISRWLSSNSGEKDIAVELEKIALEACPVETAVSRPAVNPDSGNKIGEYLR
jgi:predicted DCC family thiol-disulfide oxidoreductase YuxK